VTIVISSFDLIPPTNVVASGLTVLIAFLSNLTVMKPVGSHKINPVGSNHKKRISLL